MSIPTTVSWIFALLLAVAGAQKLRGTDATRMPPAAMGLLGAGEVALGVAVLTRGGRLLALVLAVTYAAFAAFAERQRRRGAGCGCFGTQTPTTSAHVWLDVVAAGVAVGAAAWPGTSLLATVARDPLAGALTMSLVVVAAALLRLLLTEAPELSAAAATRSGA